MKIPEDLLKPRTLFAALFYFTFCYMVLTNKELPDPLVAIVSGLFAFYFANKKPPEART